MSKLSKDEFEDLKSDICDNYCRMPAEYLMQYEDSEEAMDTMLSECCPECPLNKL